LALREDLGLRHFAKKMEVIGHQGIGHSSSAFAGNKRITIKRRWSV
jgi:hypothetical protein